MSIRVDQSQKQEKWPHGQPSWDHGHQMRKNQSENPDQDGPDQKKSSQPLTVYNSQGRLVILPPVLNVGS